MKLLIVSAVIMIMSIRVTQAVDVTYVSLGRGGHYWSADGVGYGIRRNNLGEYVATAETCSNTVAHVTVAESVTWKEEKTEYYVQNGKTNSRTVTVSYTAPVTRLDGFSYKDNLESVTINAQLEELCTGAFCSCKNLKYVTLPVSIKSIGDSAFLDCVNLLSVNIPSGVETIGKSAFYCCSKLPSMDIPQSVTNIGSYAFAACHCFDNIELPSRLKRIGDMTFGDCYNLTEINIPNGVEQIGAGAFGSCRKLKGISIPANVKTIGAGAFHNCISLRGTLTIPAHAEVYERAFVECTSLEKVSIGPGATLAISSPERYGYQFSGCTNLVEVDIKPGLGWIHRGMFSNCSSLSRITIPNTVTNIDMDAFAYSLSIESINLDDSNPVYSVRNGFLIENESNTLLVGSGLRGLRKSVVIPEGMEKVMYYVFAGSVTSIYNRDTRVYSYDIMGPTITRVSIPESMKVIDVTLF